MHTFATEEGRRKKIMGRLFAVSFISLFWEILLIRWIPSEIPFLAFFRSLVLLACFLGLGLGCIAFGRFKWKNTALVFLFLGGILIAVMTIFVAGEDLRSRGFGRHSGIYQQTTTSTLQQADHVDFTIEFEGRKGQGEAVIFGVFIFITLLFFPIGVIVARYFAGLEPLPAYLVNIAGALAGSVTFMIISFLRLPPEYWFAGGLLPLFFLVSRYPRIQMLFWSLVTVISGLIWCYDHGFQYPVVWSPYQRISCNFYYARLSGFPLGLDGDHLLEAPVFVNYDYHQSIMDYAYTRDADPQVVFKVNKELDRLYPGQSAPPPSSFYRRYAIPYSFKQTPAEVLIIAAGVGNEAAAAWRAGAENIDAVEIDPGIIEMGRRYHPEKPYQQPNVHVICGDARSFLEQSDKQYDLIVENAVDSHTQFASSAGLRLDSFIMTLEFFEQVRRHLKPDGLFAMEFSNYHWHLEWARLRILEILWRVFGYQVPEGDGLIGGAAGPMLLIGKGTPPRPETYDSSVFVSTDDWPQFFLRKPMLPKAYLILIIGVLLISAAGLSMASPGSWKQPDAHFLFLGAAFMLLEIKSITELSLILGADWRVNSIVITGVLLAIAVANLVVLRYRNIPYAVSYSIVFVSLALGFVFHPGLFLGVGFPVRVLAGVVRVAVPVFGAGLVFASSFGKSGRPPVALGWNLLGAMIGGLGEYLSLVTGVRLLGVVIIAFYGLSLASLGLKQAGETG